ncbi:V-type proton ATPase subunit S1-like protein [Microtus pennsylvanicus]|uniref:V-type proton ATPase subunit S1-like protein n=1 Tax=Microtus pennsylvanicus TaxID=10058 RepID=UPI003F6CC41C
MGRKLLFSFSLLFLCMVFSATLDQILAWKNVGSQASSRKEVIIRSGSGQKKSGAEPPAQNITASPTTQTFNYSLSKSHWSAFSHHNPVTFSRDGIPCILFWTKRITVKFKNQTWLDLTDEAPGQNKTVDTGNSNCNEESATLSLKFGDAENPKDIDIRFTLTNYNKLSSQSWFSLQRVEIIFNNSVQAAFNATGIYALSSYSYRCQRVSSLRRNDALQLLGGSDDVTSLWEVTFIDFQIQGFSIKGAQFAQARDCGSSFSPAVLIGLAMSLILLLVLAYALHMLFYLRYLDRHYEFITSPVHLPPRSELDTGEEKELLGSQGAECYELRSQQICKIYI